MEGPGRQVEQDPTPADLRIDSVLLVSVKARSAVLWNRSPSQARCHIPRGRSRHGLDLVARWPRSASDDRFRPYRGLRAKNLPGEVIGFDVSAVT
ncbi:MAG: hypothetical protein ACYDGN_14675 [Acidimicrobiales bacterium]